MRLQWIRSERNQFRSSNWGPTSVGARAWWTRALVVLPSSNTPLTTQPSRVFSAVGSSSPPILDSVGVVRVVWFNPIRMSIRPPADRSSGRSSRCCHLFLSVSQLKNGTGRVTEDNVEPLMVTTSPKREPWLSQNYLKCWPQLSTPFSSNQCHNVYNKNNFTDIRAKFPVTL